MQMTWDEMQEYREQIRIASYRWSNPRHWDGTLNSEERKENTAIPDNYCWFLVFIIQRKLIGWLDSAGIAAAGVPMDEALLYMGRIYAQNIIIGDWLLEPLKLKLAHTRGWIYQEMSFGELDKEATNNLLNEALKVPKESDGEAKLCEWAELVKSIC